LGEQDCRDIIRHWTHYGLDPGTCIEIGCGAGRMTGPLLDTFARVVAIDVSSEQLAAAQRMLGERAARVRFCTVDRPEIPVPDSSCQAMFSTHVFQHFSTFAGVTAYLRATHRALAPGASICFHMPVPGAHRATFPSALRLWLHNAKARLGRMFGRPTTMEYHRASANGLFAALEQAGFIDLELRVFPMMSNGDAHSFFFGRKA
jgi:ubiquinone/menaquinone biosynthesis C-methylase UbiE